MVTDYTTLFSWGMHLLKLKTYAHTIASCTYGSNRLMWCRHSNCGSSSTSHHSSSPSQSCSCLQYSIQYSQLLHSLWPGVGLPALVLGHCRAGFVSLQPLYYYPNHPSLQNLKQKTMRAINKAPLTRLHLCKLDAWQKHKACMQSHGTELHVLTMPTCLLGTLIQPFLAIHSPICNIPVLGQVVPISGQQFWKARQARSHQQLPAETRQPLPLRVQQVLNPAALHVFGGVGFCVTGGAEERGGEWKTSTVFT